MQNIDLYLNIYSNNLASLISIFKDSEQIRNKKESELELKIPKWEDGDFEEYTHYKYHFNWLLIESLFVSAFSHFENFIRAITEQIEKETTSKIRLNDIKGNGDLDAYRKYLFLVGNIKAANNNNKEWQILLEFKAIRNAIIHKSGRIEKPLKKIDQHKLYFGPSGKQIRIRNIDFLEDFIRTSTSYMKLIVADIITIWK